MANWVTGTCMTWVVKLFPSLNINGVFFLFCATCLVSGVSVFYHCLETKGLLLEDIEKLFDRKKASSSSSPKYAGVETPQLSAV